MIRSKKLTQYFGFTEEEVRNLCIQYEMDFDSIRQWYDGYLIDGMHMYNPNSVFQAMIDQSLEPYWKNTSAFDTINTFITMNYAGLKDDILNMLAGGKVMMETETFQNDLSDIQSKDEALTALIHLGYLGYDKEQLSAYVPNFEVAKAFQMALRTGGWNDVAATISRCDELLAATINGNTDKVTDIIQQAHETYTDKIVLAGISYDKKTKKHECVIEEIKL